jgi:hypothetical protein
MIGAIWWINTSGLHMAMKMALVLIVAAPAISLVGFITDKIMAGA